MLTLKNIFYLSILLFISGCVSTNALVKNNSEETTTGYKFFPYKSGIINYELERDGGKYTRTKIWDNWGVQLYEKKQDSYQKNKLETSKITFRDKGTIYEAYYSNNTIEKRRDFKEDYLLVAGQDLREYYVDNISAYEMYHNHFWKSTGTVTIAGYPCNVWSNNTWRFYMYKDLIVFKSEALSNNKWVIQEQVVSAKFDIPIDKKLFYLPDFPIKVHPKYIENDEMHNHMRSRNITGRGFVRSVKSFGEGVRRMMIKRKSR